MLQALWLVVIAKIESVVTGQAPIILERQDTSEKKTIRTNRKSPLYKFKRKMTQVHVCTYVPCTNLVPDSAFGIGTNVSDITYWYYMYIRTFY